MTKTCVICKKQPIPGDVTRSFHKFPTNSKLKQVWMEIIGIQNIKKVSTVCSDHFADDSYHQTGGYTKIRRLLSTAVPVVYRNNPVLKKTNYIVISSLQDETSSSDIKEEACTGDIDEYSLSNSLDSSRNTNIGVSDSNIKIDTSNCIDESDGSQDSVTGSDCDTDLSFSPPKISETTTNDELIMNCKRKRFESTLPKKKFRFMDGCQTYHVSRDDFISDEAWGRFLKLMRIKNNQITAAQKKSKRREKQISNFKEEIKNLREID